MEDLDFVPMCRVFWGKYLPMPEIQQFDLHLGLGLGLGFGLGGRIFHKSHHFFLVLMTTSLVLECVCDHVRERVREHVREHSRTGVREQCSRTPVRENHFTNEHEHELFANTWCSRTAHLPAESRERTANEHERTRTQTLFANSFANYQPCFKKLLRHDQACKWHLPRNYPCERNYLENY